MENCKNEFRFLRKGRIPANEVRYWKVQGPKKRIIQRETEDCGMSLRREVSWRSKGYGRLRERKILEDRGALPRKEGDQMGEYKAVHEETVSASWLRDDVKEGKSKSRCG